MGLRCCGSPPRQLAGSRSPADKTEKLCCCPFYLPAAEVSSSSHHQVTFFGSCLFECPFRACEARCSDRLSPNSLHRGRHAVATLQVLQLVAALFLGTQCQSTVGGCLGLFRCPAPRQDLAASRARKPKETLNKNPKHLKGDPKQTLNKP